MKVAITSTGKDLESLTDERFGRAKYFIIYDTEAKNFEVIDNSSNVNAERGAGIGAAESIVEKGVEYVITGNCGPKAYRVLSEAGVKVILGLNGKIKEVIEKFEKGEYSIAKTSNVEIHKGKML